jgi:DNA (cytosine-5)-methyltransferase 1
MSGRVGHRKRLICVSAANLRWGHLYLTGHADFFPADCYGAPSEKDGVGKMVQLDVEGVSAPVYTDIPTDATSGNPRRFFRKRAWVREFFAKHGIKPGDTIAIERVNSHHFRVQPFEAKEERQLPAVFSFDREPEGDGPRVIELFAGCGGMALGFKKAGFRTVLANEWDRDACDSLRANITDRVLNCAIQEIEHFPDADVVAGGPPCQGFSNLGERVPNDPRNQLWRHYLRCVEQVRPKVFVLENVPPLLNSAEYQELLRIARSLGYRVDGRVLNTANYGVPQTRKRAIVIGSRIGEPSFPAQTHVDPLKRDLLTENLPDWRTVRDAIGQVPLIPTGINWHIGRNPTPKSILRYRCIKEGGNRWQLPADLMPDCWKRKTKGGTDLFGRLWWDRPSVTIRTEFYKPEKGRYLHPVANRPITHHEAALLQSFPEDFIFCGTKIKVGIQIGNAVPPLFALAIANHVAAILGMEAPGILSIRA